MEGRRERASGDAGFSLIEVVVAITLAAVLLTGGAHALGSSLKAAVFARNNTQVAELMSETIEGLRSTDYAALAMVAADLTDDPAIGGIDPAYTFDPDGSGPLEAEAVVLAATGSVNPHVTSHTRNSQVYDLRTYVTAPSDAAVATAGYKRITVRATWTVGSRTHERQASTIVTQTRRGLPLPNFQVVATAGEAADPIVANTGSTLVLPFDVVNRGARDSFNLSMASSPATTASFDFVIDADGSGTLDASEVSATDADGDGKQETGTLEVDETRSMLAVATVPDATVSGDYTFTVTATSVAQPTAGGATRTADFAVEIISDTSCDGCTFQPVYLRNQYPACAVEPCDSTAQATMPLRTEAPTAPGLANFDTDFDTGLGRTVQRADSTPGSTTTATNLAATWRYYAPQNLTLSGEVIVDLRVGVAGSGSTPGSNKAVGVRVYASRSTSGSGATELLASGTASYGELGTTEFHPVRVRIPVSTTVAKNRFLELKLVVESTTSVTDVWLAYDATDYAAVAYLPVA